MRTFLLAIFLTFTFGLSCDAFSQPNGGDTINFVDDAGKKQGYWIIFGTDKPTSGYAGDQKVEEGAYLSSRKTGPWKRYYPNDNLKSIINYVNNRPNGDYITYYETGKIEEEGNWTNNRNTGTFKRFHKNGNVAQDFVFNETGKRDGVQKYYHENGQLEVEVNIAQGKEEGQMRRFYANGDLKEEKFFNGGVLDQASVKTYEPKQPLAAVVEEPDVEARTTEVNTVDVVNPGSKPVKGLRGVPDGYNKLYNKNRAISQDGYFKNGKLLDGKWYRYDDNGILEAIEIYKNGKYIGDGVIED
jgi:antitoxin component YwqK of YwqJK toxin-antitoxin module